MGLQLFDGVGMDDFFLTVDGWRESDAEPKARRILPAENRGLETTSEAVDVLYRRLEPEGSNISKEPNGMSLLNG